MTAIGIFRLSKSVFALTVFLFPVAQAGAQNFAMCRDPEVRRQMSVLQAAVAGPSYSSRTYVEAQKRFEDNVQNAASVSRPTTSAEIPQISPRAYLHELEFTSRRMVMEGLLQMMWEIYDPQALPDSHFRVAESRLPWEASSLVCQRDCPSDVRDRLRQEAAVVLKNLKSDHVPRRTLQQTAEILSTDAEGLTQVLQAALRGTGGTTVADYFSDLAQVSLAGVGRLWLTPSFHALLNLPTGYEQIRCLLQGKCALPSPQAFTAEQVRRALQEYDRQLLYQNLDRDNFVLPDDAPSQNVDSRIADFYRYSPLAVARLSAEQPAWSRFHCRYLALSLQKRGEEQNWKLDTHEIARLLPMGGFWLVGLGSGMMNKGKVSPLAFTFATLVGLLDLGFESYQLSREHRTLDETRGSALSAQVDHETLVRYFNTLEIYEKNKNERDKKIMEETATIVLSLTVARIVVYGVRGAFAAKITADVVTKNMARGKMFQFLRSRRIHNAEELRRFLAQASGHDLAEIKELLRTGYEYTLPGALISIHEVWKAFEFKGYELEALERTL